MTMVQLDLCCIMLCKVYYKALFTQHKCFIALAVCPDHPLKLESAQVLLICIAGGSKHGVMVQSICSTPRLDVLRSSLSTSFSAATICSFHSAFSIISSDNIMINSPLDSLFFPFFIHYKVVVGKECIFHQDCQQEAELSCWSVSGTEPLFGREASLPVIVVVVHTMPCIVLWNSPYWNQRSSPPTLRVFMFPSLLC